MRLNVNTILKAGRGCSSFVTEPSGGRQARSFSIQVVDLEVVLEEKCVKLRSKREFLNAWVFQHTRHGGCRELRQCS